MGTKIETPTSFHELLPLVKEIVAKLGLRKGEVHPFRKEVSTFHVGSEVGLEDKQNFMKSSMGRQINAAAGQRLAPPERYPVRREFPGGKGMGHTFGRGQPFGRGYPLGRGVPGIGKFGQQNGPPWMRR